MDEIKQNRPEVIRAIKSFTKAVDEMPGVLEKWVVENTFGLLRQNNVVNCRSFLSFKVCYIQADGSHVFNEELPTIDSVTWGEPVLDCKTHRGYRFNISADFKPGA